MQEKPVPTFQDVDAFLNAARTDPYRCYRQVAEWLNTLAVPQENSSRLFVPEDVDKLLVDSPLYRFEVLYPPDMNATALLDIQRQGGVFMLSDVVAYLKQIRQQKHITIETLEAALKFSIRGVSRLETESVERIKLIDVLLLDEQLEQEGKVLAMYWSTFLFLEYLSSVQIPTANLTDDRGRTLTNRQEKLALLFMLICRWWQSTSEHDASWMTTLRQHLRLLNTGS